MKTWLIPSFTLAIAALEIGVSSVAFGQSTQASSARAVTVRIEGPLLGSGVLIARRNHTYTILTNYHVLVARGQYVIQTSDGQRHLVRNRQRLNGADLALATFESNRPYPIAMIGDSSAVQVGEKIHISGYPRPRIVNGERTYNFYSDTLTGRLSRPLDGYQLIFNNAGIKGMSGSPIFNDYGQLIGIFGLSEGADGQQLSTYGIPINLAKGLANRQGIAIPWRTGEPIGRTPQQMGKEQYADLVLLAKHRLSSLSRNQPKVKLKFPAGVNYPLRLGSSTDGNFSTSIEVIGYVDRANRVQGFTPEDLLQLIDNVAGIVAHDPWFPDREITALVTQKIDHKRPHPILAQSSPTPIVIDIIIYDPNRRKMVRLPSVEIKSLFRDIINATLNNTLERHDYNIEGISLR